MRGKKISMDNAKKLTTIMNKFADDKDMLIQLMKADIPFVSQGAVTRLISKHGMKGAELNKMMKEDVDLDEGFINLGGAKFSLPVVFRLNVDRFPRQLHIVQKTFAIVNTLGAVKQQSVIQDMSFQGVV